ncbi:MAG: hypothetical protein JSR96_08505 [Proteobacteria bacterium]|nr:hypothetical protein [Pseudomonadota bacterium]
MTLFRAAAMGAALSLSASFVPAVLAQNQATTAAPAAKLAVGAMVYGPQGIEVGKIEKIDGDTVIVATGKNSAALARTSFANGEKGPVIGFTRDQLDTAVGEAQAKADAKVDAALVAGAAVHSSDGVAVGTVKTVNEDGTVVLEGKDRTFALKKDTFTTDTNGLALHITAKQLADALAQPPADQPSADPTPAASPASN